MNPDRSELSELRERIAKLTPELQLLLAEGILANIRKAHFTDHEADRKSWEAMLADPDYQRVLNNEDLPYPEPGQS